jgi:tetratricopeptide (TPR) repeat protein
MKFKKSIDKNNKTGLAIVSGDVNKTKIKKPAIKHIKIAKLKTFAPIIFALVIILGATLGWLLIDNNKQTDVEVKTAETQKSALEKSTTQGYDKTKNDLLNQANKADGQEKTEILSTATNLALNNNDNQEAIKIGSEAGATNNLNSSGYASLAYAYEKSGDYVNASIYFGKAAVASPDKSSVGDTEYNFYMQKKQENEAR